RSATRGAAHGGGADGVRREPGDGVPAVEFERFTGIAPDDGERAGICFYGMRSREGAICCGGSEKGAAKRGSGYWRTSATWGGWETEEIRRAGDEVHCVHAWSGSMGTAATFAAAGFAESKRGARTKPIHGGSCEGRSGSGPKEVARVAVGARSAV